LITTQRRTAFFRVKTGTEHYPVLYREVHNFVNEYINHNADEKPQFQMLDCTFGGGNHSIPLLRQHKNLRVLGVDLDSKVLEQCRDQYEEEFIDSKRLALEHSNYVHVPHIDVKGAFRKKIGIKDKWDIAILDLGFSSYQLEDPTRGFSYIGADDQPLDMRYDSEKDKEQQSQAFDILNNATELELSEIFKKFGEERFHDQLAGKIIEERSKKASIIKSTGDFKQAIRDAFPNSAKDEKNQMIKRAF
jgi:16S rRNA (cytosine1402-N4)-methyltransferase